ncbi:hypothetical protein CY34DRAFT_499139 [Suillus luteus UH-Slu-Lm8-n1]|uniref:WD40 repeat-like protein n=1 Tax=Suillus luteus UH-Slu-Lm8-n1 TaxID=930992 RepID=A0A0D0AEX4_9AGAM|nr:hypothetical protein CY34DRAFT_499139 [Suillus luteus UH-Slu-Lm8-n1]
MSSSISDTPAITPRQKMRGHTEPVRGVVHLPGGQRIITCSLDGSLRLWDLESSAQIGKDWRVGTFHVKLRSIALSPNGKIVASGGDDGKVRLWNVKMRKVVAKSRGRAGIVSALCWSADGERLASGSWDGTARIWDIDSGKHVLTIKTGHIRAWAVMYSPDLSKLATGGYKENAVKIWDAKTGELLNTFEHNTIVRCLAWTSDGKKFISNAFDQIRIFDTATWQQIAILEGHALSVTAISLSPNDRLLASASSDKTARLWNLDTNLPVGPPLYHGQSLYSAALSPDRKVLVTTCEDTHSVYVWDVHSILEEAGLEDLLSIDINIAPKDTQIQEAPRNVYSAHLVLRSVTSHFWKLMPLNVLTSLAAMNSHQRFLPAWKPMLIPQWVVHTLIPL